MNEKNNESNNVKDGTTPNYGCPEIRSNTLETTQNKFQPYFTTSYATIERKNNKQQWQPGKGSEEEEGGAGEQCGQ